MLVARLSSAQLAGWWVVAAPTDDGEQHARVCQGSSGGYQGGLRRRGARRRSPPSGHGWPGGAAAGAAPAAGTRGGRRGATATATATAMAAAPAGRILDAPPFPLGNNNPWRADGTCSVLWLVIGRQVCSNSARETVAAAPCSRLNWMQLAAPSCEGCWSACAAPMCAHKWTGLVQKFLRFIVILNFLMYV